MNVFTLYRDNRWDEFTRNRIRTLAIAAMVGGGLGGLTLGCYLLAPLGRQLAPPEVGRYVEGEG